MRALDWLRRKFASKAKPKAERRYSGAEQSDTLLDWIVGSTTANQEIRGDMRLLRNRSRDLAQNDSIARQYLRLLTANVVGPKGVMLEARARFSSTGNLREPLNEQIETAWERWAKRPTVSGRQSLIGLSQLLLRTVAADGEAIVLMHEGFDNRPWRRSTRR
jgi:capsid protein